MKFNTVKSKVLLFLSILTLLGTIFCFVSCDNFLSQNYGKTTININLDLSKLIKNSRNDDTQINGYVLKLFVYDAKNYQEGDKEIEKLPLLTQTSNKVDISGTVKASLEVAIDSTVIFVGKLFTLNENDVESEKPLYAGKSEVIKVQPKDNKVHLVLSRDKAEIGFEIELQESHEHTFSSEWSTSATHHWRKANCEHTEEVSKFAEHTFSAWTTTKEPTEEEAGSKERVCSVCNYKETAEIAQLAHTHKFSSDWTKDETYHWKAATCGHTSEVSEKSAHSYGNWTTTTEPTEEEAGSKERICSVCNYKETAEIAQLAHTHKYATEWTKDETYHWKVATCEHAEEVSEKSAHSYGNWTTTKEATEEEVGIKERSCDVCNYKETAEIAQLVHTHTFSSDWVIYDPYHWREADCEHSSEVTDFGEHSFPGEFIGDETGHGKKCICGKISEFARHSGEWTVTEQATETDTGSRYRYCEICGYYEEEIIGTILEGFAFIPKGSFQMGSNAGESSEKPVHEVTLTKNFYMGKYEVTQGEYEKYCTYGETSPSSSIGDGDNFPVYYVSWYDALVYCNKRSIAEGLTPCYRINEETDPTKWGTVPTDSNSTWNAVVCDWEADGYRLPTEAEWEYAARAGDYTVDTLTYSGTNDVNKLRDYAWYNGDSTHKVGTKNANAFGLYDMSGNILEMCWNRYTNSYDTTTEGGSDPTGALSGSNRVSRGGLYTNNPDSCSVSSRSLSYPYYRYSFLGFRLVRASSK